MGFRGVDESWECQVETQWNLGGYCSLRIVTGFCEDQLFNIGNHLYVMGLFSLFDYLHLFDRSIGCCDEFNSAAIQL